MKILVGYYSRTGNTKKMAQAIAKGVKKEGLKVDLKTLKDIKPADLVDYQAIIFGSPTYYGQMAAEMKKLIDETVRYHGRLAGKIGGAFTSCGAIGCGGETTVLSILKAFLIHGMTILGEAGLYHYGPVSIQTPNQQVVNSCIRYGQKIARATRQFFSD